MLGKGVNFQKFKQRQNFDTTTEVNLSKYAKMGKQLLIGQFWPKILFFHEYLPSFGLYIYEQNLNCPLGLKQANSGCPWPYGPQQPESASFRFLSSIYDSNYGTQKKLNFWPNCPFDSCFPTLN